MSATAATLVLAARRLVARAAARVCAPARQATLRLAGQMDRKTRKGKVSAKHMVVL
jgi:hypothetical protein